MSSLFKHIVLMLFGLCGVLVVQARLPLDESNAAFLILAAVSISSVILAVVGASLVRRYDFVWIALPAAIYATALFALITRADLLSGPVLMTSAGAILVMAGTAWIATRSSTQSYAPVWRSTAKRGRVMFAPWHPTVQALRNTA